MKDKIISKYLPPLLFGMYLESSIPPDEDVGIYLSNRFQSLINTLAMQDLGNCQVSGILL